MANNIEYQYLLEDFRNERLICIICTKPLIDPVSTKCEPKSHIFCRHCIENWLNHNSSCYMCYSQLHTQDLTPVTDNDLIDALNNILIKCLQCNQTCIKRGMFNDHKTKICPKADVSCSASDIKCPWIGPRDQLNNRLQICPLNLLRPVIVQLQDENQRRISQINHQQIQIEQLQNENMQLKDGIKKLKECLQLESMSFQRYQSVQVDNKIKQRSNGFHLWKSLSFRIKSNILRRSKTIHSKQTSTID